jgi:hypothetical protein
MAVTRKLDRAMPAEFFEAASLLAGLGLTLPDRGDPARTTDRQKHGARTTL